MFEPFVPVQLYEAYSDIQRHNCSSSNISYSVYSKDLASTFASKPTTKSRNQQDPGHKSCEASYSIPRGFEKLLQQAQLSPPSHASRKQSNQSRYHLHVREQPIKARSCGTRDRYRRLVDPPPIVQMLLTDFDPESQEDCAIFRDPRFTVSCLLFPDSASSQPSPPLGADQRGLEQRPKCDVDDNTNDTIPLLSGKTFVSPFFVEADPDPASAPMHPSSDTAVSSTHSLSNLTASCTHQAATFFVFADLSVRSAGVYRLQFKLMNWGCVEDTGQSIPVFAETWSNSFRVYPPKDFPGMQNSSLLVKGLKDLGFAELRARGKDDGKGRRKR